MVAVYAKSTIAMEEEGTEGHLPEAAAIQQENRKESRCVNIQVLELQLVELWLNKGFGNHLFQGEQSHYHTMR
jgi:hypothetical protein